MRIITNLIIQSYRFGTFLGGLSLSISNTCIKVLRCKEYSLILTTSMHGEKGLMVVDHTE